MAVLFNAVTAAGGRLAPTPEVPRIARERLAGLVREHGYLLGRQLAQLARRVPVDIRPLLDGAMRELEAELDRAQHMPALSRLATKLHPCLAALPLPEAAHPAAAAMCPRVALAFSGGGCRAAAQGLGALEELGEALERVDHISSVSGGGYAATSWLAWAESITQQEGSSPEVLQQAARSVKQAAAARMPYSTVGWMLRAVLLLLLNMVWTASMGCFLHQTWTIQWLIIFRGVGIGENADIVVLVVATFSCSGICGLCVAALNDPASFQKITPKSLLVLLVAMGVSVGLFYAANGMLGTSPALLAFLLYGPPVLCICVYCLALKLYSEKSTQRTGQVVITGVMKLFGIVCAGFVLTLLYYLLFRLNPHYSWTVSTLVFGLEIPLQLCFALLILMAVATSFAVVRRQNTGEAFGTANNQSFNLQLLATDALFAYARLQFLIIAMWFSGGLFKDFRCELPQVAGQADWCNWPPCQSASTACYSYDNAYLRAHFATDTQLYYCGAATTCELKQPCYICDQYLTIPESYNRWHNIYLPFAMAMYGLQILLLPVQIRLHYGLGITQEQELVMTFYPEKTQQSRTSRLGLLGWGWLLRMVGLSTLTEDVVTIRDLADCMEESLAMPVPVINAAQHGFVSYCSQPLLGKETTRSHCLFEFSPWAWGSDRIGYQNYPQGESHRTELETGEHLRLSTAMAISGAATSCEVGSYGQQSSSVLGLEKFIAWLALETGRWFRWGDHCNAYTPSLWVQLFGLSLGLAQMGLLYYRCDQTGVAAASWTSPMYMTLGDGDQKKFAGGYDCLDRDKYPEIYILAAVSIAFMGYLLAGITFGQLNLPGTSWLDGAAFNPFVLTLIKRLKFTPTVNHREPKLIFLADGGHYDNLAICPLLRRRARYIIAVNSSDQRNSGELKRSMALAQKDANCEFMVPGRSQSMSRELDNFHRPRALLDMDLLINSSSFMDQEITSRSGEGCSRVSDPEDPIKLCRQLLLRRFPGVRAVDVDPRCTDPTPLVFVSFDDAPAMNNAIEELSCGPGLNPLSPSPVCDMTAASLLLKLSVTVCSQLFASGNRPNSELVGASVGQMLNNPQIGSLITEANIVSQNSGSDWCWLRLDCVSTIGAEIVHTACWAAGFSTQMTLVVTLQLSPPNAEPPEAGDWPELASRYAYGPTLSCQPPSELRRAIESLQMQCSAVNWNGVTGCLEDSELSMAFLAIDCDASTDWGEIRQCVANSGLQLHRGITFDSTYRHRLTLDLCYVDSPDTGVLHVVQSELPQQERAEIMAVGSTTARSSNRDGCCHAPGMPPSGSFPYHQVSTEAYSPAQFEAYSRFSRQGVSMCKAELTDQPLGDQGKVTMTVRELFSLEKGSRSFFGLLDESAGLLVFSRVVHFHPAYGLGTTDLEANHVELEAFHNVPESPETFV